MRSILRPPTVAAVGALCFASSALVLGHALQMSNGFFHPVALRWLTAALVFVILGAVASRSAAPLTRGHTLVLTVLLAGGVAWQIQQLLAAEPGYYVSATASRTLFRTLVATQGMCILLGLLDVSPARRSWFPLVLATSLCLGIWMIKASPEPYIDVIQVHKEALAALLDGTDPYRITFANIYEGVDARKFYNPDALIGGRLAFAYPYPPASLLFSVPGYVLFGDYRYSELALLVAAAALIGYTRHGRLAPLAACTLLTTPRVWFVIEQGWTEPVAVFALALTVFLLVRYPMSAGWAAGLLLTTKQYLAFGGLVVLRFVFVRPWRWMWLGASVAISAAATTLPFALWHPNAFMRNVVWLQSQEPFRPDSLSYLAWAFHNGLGQGTFVWAAGAAAVAAILCLFITRNTPVGFAASFSLTTFVLFAFGSKAFCNYYFFVIGAVCATVAAFQSDTVATHDRAFRA